jgi:benzodiazapine receptor
MMDAPFWTAIPFLALVLLASSTGAIFKPGVWYRELEKPSWTPPNWLFPVAWAGLFVMMAYAAWRVWQLDGVGVPLVLWGVQLGLNALWSAIFFGMKRLGLALVELMAMWVAIAATLIAFAQIDLLAAALLAPYLVWVSFAGALNFAILRRQGSPA